MHAERDHMESRTWIEDLSGLGLDELRDLPFGVQAGLDLSVFD